MDWDRLPAARRIAKRDRLLARYLREEVHPFSPTEARRLDAAGLAGGRIASADDLARVAPVDPADVDGLASVLRPTAAGLAASPERLRWWWATVTGRRASFVDEEIEPRFRTIHFDDHGDLVVASSAADLDRLADLGRRALGLAGLRRDDAVVTLLPTRGDLSFWTVALGCRRGGVAALHLGDARPGTEVAGYAPSVLAGTAAALRRVVGEAPELAATVGLLVVTERLTGDARAELGARFPGAEVRALWSPPGVRAPWAECAAGRLHTWPDAEVVQTVDRDGRVTRGAGAVVWTPLGWRGTVVLRLRTGLRGRLVDDPCPCGATSPRLEVLDAVDEPPAPAAAPGPGRRRADHGVMADAALADAFFADDPATALASYADAGGGDADAGIPGAADLAADAPTEADAGETGLRSATAVDVGTGSDAADEGRAGEPPARAAASPAAEAHGDAEEAAAAGADDAAADATAPTGPAGDDLAVARTATAGADAVGSAGGRSGRVAGRSSGRRRRPVEARGEAVGPGGPPGGGEAEPRRPAESGRGAPRGDGGRHRPTPRDTIEDRLAAVLDLDDRIRAWTAEAAATDDHHLVVWLAPVVGQRAAVEADLARLGAALGASRVVVERPSIVRQRLESAGGTRVTAIP